MSNNEADLEKQNDLEPNKKKDSIVRKIIFSLCLIIFVISLTITLGKIIAYSGQTDGYEAAYEDLEDIAKPEEDDESIDFDALMDENSDTKAWLTIPGTDIDHVVVQRSEEATDGEDYYYLERDFYGEYSEYGTLFFDPTATVESGEYSQNLIIYGHNMKNGEMFGDLSNYEDEEFYKEHPTITLATPEGTYTYEIFSVLETSIYPSERDPEPFYYMQCDFDTQAAFMAYVEEAKSRSLYEIPVEVNEGDEILTLSTCDDVEDDDRFVVFAVKVDE